MLHLKKWTLFALLAVSLIGGSFAFAKAHSNASKEAVAGYTLSLIHI